MRALIVYTSWFGHTRLMARALAEELEAHGISVVCTPVDKIDPGEVLGYTIMLLGTHSHIGRAPRQLRELCDAIPPPAVVSDGDWYIWNQDRIDQSGGQEELADCLQERGCPPVLPPFWIERIGSAMVLPEQQLSDSERNEARAFAAEIAEMCLPVAM